MDEQHLIPMANRIAEFFATQPRQEEQVDGVIDHLRLFWAPQMRRQLVSYIEQQSAQSAAAPQGQESIHPLVRQAVLEGRERLLTAAD